MTWQEVSYGPEQQVKGIEIKHILKAALTDEIHSREVYKKGIDHSCYYEGYKAFKAEEL